MTADKLVAHFRALFELFGTPSPVDIPSFGAVPASEVPRPYRDLLVHDRHMTVTLENFHGGPVQLRILRQVKHGNYYARMILLALERTDEVVQFGIVRIHLSSCSEAVQAEILGGNTPLGRILIAHDVLRHIEPWAYLKITPNHTVMQWFGMQEQRPVFGRLATIYCSRLPAIELLEVVRPESSGSGSGQN